ncbi:hypothetical protein ACHAXR_010637 [Thalassiosira sp. AJA248-18]
MPMMPCNKSMGAMYANGVNGYQKDLCKAFRLPLKAAELGLPSAHSNVSEAYYDGEGVMENAKKGRYHLEQAAIGGNEKARHNLGVEEAGVGNMSRAMKHFMIAARAGYKFSLDAVRDGCHDGYATRDEYGRALRSYKVFLDETKSEQRDRAAAALRLQQLDDGNTNVLVTLR